MRQIQPDHVLQFDVEVIQTATPEDFLKEELDFGGTFDDVEEWRAYSLAMAKAYPEGITAAYFNQSLEQYHFNKSIANLEKYGLIRISEDEEGRDTYQIDPNVKIIGD